jgi:hypothetical protein
MASTVFSIVEQLAITGIQLLLHTAIKNPTSTKAKRLRDVLVNDVQPLIDEALRIIPE